jgi:hypothetical protein
MDARRYPLAVCLLTLGLLAAITPRARAFSAQETADREGDQSDMSSSEVASPFVTGALKNVAADMPESGHLYDDAIRGILGDGIWGVEVVLIEADGRVVTLADLNENASLMPASTMKVFTSWFGLVKTVELRALGREPLFPAPWTSYELYAAFTLKNSDNNKAKAILKKFAPVKGPAVLEKFYADLGLAGKDELKVVDGAGLSTVNRATAHLEVSLLNHIRESAHYLDYREFLAKPRETGTLRERLRDLKGALFAKTGTLTATRVAALTGYLDMGENGTILFSIIGNDPHLAIDVQRERIDQVVERLDHDAANHITPADANVAVLRRLDMGRFPKVDSVFR